MNQKVVARAVRIRPAVTEAGDRAVHKARVELGQRLVIQPILRQPAGLEVLHQHVALRRQITHDLLAFGLGDVHRHRLLVAVGAHVIRRLARAFTRLILHERRAPGARVVSGLGALDLDDLGAQIAQRLRGPGAGQHAREIQHLHMLQCAVVRHCCGTLAWMTMRFHSAISFFWKSRICCGPPVIGVAPSFS
ncbi:hypothetical protein SDC9_101273 [bioreactor metagenome]|uniref:Uncharacterized protein n=1 Tax=bioreactor metagenome TaxID=1076179 RepID=A0A645AMP7_9ZZZZ